MNTANEAVYIVSTSKNIAIRHAGGMHHMTLKKACRGLDDDAIALRVFPCGVWAQDLLKLVSSGHTHLSVTQRELIAAAA